LEPQKPENEFKLIKAKRKERELNGEIDEGE